MGRAVKRMTATSAFLDMPYEHRGCNVELFQDCKTRRLLKACQCVPWELGESFGTCKNVDALTWCNPKGRDCIEAKSTQNFNCTVNCEGLHADFTGRLEEDNVNTILSGLETKIQPEKGSKIGKGHSFKHVSRMISEYRRLKKNMVTKFNFNAYAIDGQFGEEVPESTLELVHIFFDTATFDKLERDKKIKYDAQLSLIGGTMGLLTGFSIISGVEIIFFLFRLFRSFTGTTRADMVKAVNDKFKNHLVKKSET